MTDINDVRALLERLADNAEQYGLRVLARPEHVRALLDDHARLQRAAGLGAELLESLEAWAPRAPDQNCSCHISAPCSDCADWGGLRELRRMVADHIMQHAKAVQP